MSLLISHDLLLNGYGRGSGVGVGVGVGVGIASKVPSACPSHVSRASWTDVNDRLSAGDESSSASFLTPSKLTSKFRDGLRLLT